MKHLQSAMRNVLGYFVSFWIIFLLSLLNCSSLIRSIGWHFPSLDSVARIGLPLLILVLVIGFATGVAIQVHLAARLKTLPPLHDLMSVFVFLASLVFWGSHLFGEGYASKMLLLLSPVCYLLMMSLDLIVLRFAQSDLLGRWVVAQRKLTVVLFNVALFIGLVLTFESVFRLATHNQPYGTPDYGTRYDFVLSPYLMFSEPDVDNGGLLNLQGFEGPMLPPREKAKREIRIAVLGGSAAWSGGRFKSIAGFLEQELKSHPSTKGFDLKVVNFGRQSYISMQELILLQRNVLPLGFDLIIVYDGFNDIWIPRDEPLGIGYPFLYSALKKRVESSRFINIPVAMNALAKKSSIVTFLRGGVTKRRLPSDRFDLGRCLEEYNRNLTQMAILGGTYGSKMVFVTQPFVGTKKIRTEQEDRFLSPEEMLAMQSYYRELSAAGQEVARKTNSHYIHMLDVFDDMPGAVFYDFVHIKIEEGNPIVARRIAQRLTAENLFP